MFKLPHVIAFFVLVLAPGLAAQGSPPPGYNWIQNPANDHYYAVTSQLTWAQAKAEVDALPDVELVTIRNQAENGWLHSTFYPLSAVVAFIGFSDEAQEGIWVWRSGEPTIYENWSPNNPDDALGGQDAGTINIGAGSLGGTWDDAGPPGNSNWTAIAIIEFIHVDADVNGDGFDDVVVGAPQADLIGQYNAGAAYVYSGIDGSLLFQWNGLNDSEYFGDSVSDAGDVNADGFDDLIWGVPYAANNGLSGVGKSFVMSGADGSVLFGWSGDADSDYFGSSVSGAGDINSDGYADLIVGANGHDYQGLNDAGAVYVYSGIDGALLYRWHGDAAADHIGWSVSDAGDVNADGLPDLIVGAPDAKSGWGAGVSTGSAFVYSWSPFLFPENLSISASSGGIMGYQIDFPRAAALENYKVLVSVSGTGSFHYGVEIPLALDSYVINTFYGQYPFAFSTGMQGNLDSDGRAYATFGALPGTLTSVVGLTVHMAVISMPTLGPPNYSSAAVPVTIFP
jgi:hypothetical protein